MEEKKARPGSERRRLARLTACVAAACGLSLTLAPSSGQAQSTTWTNGLGDNNWNSAGNWNNGVPGSTTTAIFDSTAGGGSANIGLTGASVKGINFTSNAYTTTVSSGGSFRIGTGSIANTAGTTEFFVVSGDGLLANGTPSSLSFTGTGTITGPVQITADASGGLSTGAGSVLFQQGASAGDATLIGTGGTANQSTGGTFQFFGGNMGTSNITLYGGTGNNTSGASMSIRQGSNGGTATIDIEGGSNGGRGALVRVDGNSNVSGVSVTCNGNGLFDITSNGNTAVGSIAGSGTFTLGGNVLTVGGNNASTTVSGVISDGPFSTGSSLVKTGTGTMILSGTNTYTGSTTVNGGTLQLGTAGSAGSIGGVNPIGINSGGTLSIVNIPGTGGVSTFTNSVSNGVSGTGTLNVNSANTNILSGAITDGAAGTIGLTQSGTGTTILTSLNNTFTGATSITGGTLQIGGVVNSTSVGGTLNAASNISIGSAGTLNLFDVVGGTLGNQITAANNATLNITSTAPVTLTGKISSGASDLNVNVSGDAILASSSVSYFGTTTVQNGATLQMGTTQTATAFGLSSLVVDAGGTLVVNHLKSGSLFGVNGGAGTGVGVVNINSASDVNFLSPLTDGGTAQLSVQQTGIATTTLSGASTYTGQTLITAGTLAVTGSLGNTTVNVQGGTLTGNGTISGTVNLAGGTLIPNNTNSAGSITIGTLNLNSGSSVFRLSGTGTSDSVNVTNSLTLGGTLSVQQSTGFAAGTYALYNYGTTVSGNFASIVGLPGYNVTTSTSGGAVSLVVTNLGTAQYWDGTNQTANGTVAGGSGNWNTSSVNWTNSTGTTVGRFAGGTAIFNSPFGTVTINGPVTAQALIFNSGNYTVAGTALTMTGPSPTISVEQGGPVVSISAPIAGTAGLNIGGVGTVALTGTASTYTGATNVIGGTLQLGTLTSAGAIPTASAVTVQDGGTLSLEKMTGTTLVNNISNGVVGLGTVQTTFLTVTLSGKLTDGAAGQLGLDTTIGSNVTLTNANNTFSGPTTVTQSTLFVGTASAPGSIGANSAIQVHIGGTLDLVNVAGGAMPNSISSGSGDGTVTVNSTGTLTLSGTISDTPGTGLGTITLNQTGTGKTILAGLDSYSKGTTVSAGTLQVGNGTSGNLTGAGAVTLSNSAALILDQGNNDTSMTPDIVLGTAGNTVTAMQTGSLAINGVISGLGFFNQNGTGTTELVAAETYTGVTNVNAGTLQVDTSLASNTVHVGTNGILTGDGTIAGNVSVTGNGVINLGTSSVIGGTLTVTGGNWNGGGSVSGVITSSGNTFTIGSGATLFAGAGLNVTGGQLAGTGTIQGNVTESSTVSSTFDGVIADQTGIGTSALTMNMGAATLTLTGMNTYTGATTINSGTLNLLGSLDASSTVHIGSSGTLAGTGLVNGSATITGNGTINLGAGGQISGVLTSTGGKWIGVGNVGSAVNANSGTFTLNGTLSTLVLTINGGTLAGTGTLNAGLNYFSSSNSTFAGTINNGGNGINVTSGTGTLTLTGPVNSNTISVNTGTLQIGNGTAGFAPTSSANVNVTSVLVLDLPTGENVGAGISFNNPTASSAINMIQPGTTTLSGAVGGSGVGTLNQNGTGTTIITGIDYAGATKVNKGTLQIGDGATPGAGVSGGSVIVAAGATLALNVDSSGVNGTDFSEPITLGGATAAVNAIPSVGTTQTITGTITGAGVFNQNGLGTTIIDSGTTQAYTGATNVLAGTLDFEDVMNAASTVNVGTNGTLTGSGNILGKATLTGNGTIDLGTNGQITGTLAVTGGNWTGAGKVSGLITSSSGTFTIANGATLNAPGGLTVTGGTLAGTGTFMSGLLTYASSSNSTFAGTIAGPAAGVTMNKAGATLTLTGQNSYGSATTVNAGTLQVGDGATVGASLGSNNATVNGTGVLALDLTDGGVFSNNATVNGAGATVKALQSGKLTVSGAITGTGGFTQAGTGTTIFSVNEGYTGTTTVSAGTLQVDGQLGATTSTVNVGAGATLSGLGTIFGAVNVLAGGSLAAGDSSTPGTLTIGKLVLNSAATSVFRLAGTAATNDLINVTGNLTLAGTIDITQSAGFGAGVYTLFDYTGTLTNTGITALNGTYGYNVSISTSTAHEVNLIVSGSAVTQYWDGNGPANNSVINGGAGTWDLTSAKWTDGGGVANSTWSGGTAVFAGASGGTVMLAKPINAQGLFFTTTGYTLSGTSALNLVGTPTTMPVVSTGSGVTATIGVPLTGNAGLGVNGGGLLILTNGSNTYTGGTQVTNGTLQIGTTAAPGSLGGGTVAVGQGATLNVVNIKGNLIANNITNGSNTITIGLVTMNSTLTNTISGSLTDGSSSGVLGLTQSGTGTTILTNAGNTFTGPITVTKGTLQLGTTTAIGSIGSAAISMGPSGTLLLTNLTGNTLANDVTTGGGGTGTVTINSAKNNTLSGALTNGGGTLALTQSGTGTTTLTGTNTYSGATTISAGTLQLGDGTNGSFTGTGKVTLSGTSTLALDLPDTQQIMPIINLSAATATLKGLELANQTNTVTGIISGTGGVTQLGAGTTVLQGTNTYTGATNITNGTLKNNGVIAAGSTVNVGTAGTLTGNGSILGKATLTGNGTIDISSSAIIDGTLTVTGGNWSGQGTVASLITSSSGAFNLTGTLAAPKGLALTGGTFTGTGTLTGSFTDTSSTSETFGGTIGGTTSVVTMNKASTTLTLTGPNSYGGATTITAGTLQIGDGTTTGAKLGGGTSVATTAAAGTLAIDLADTETFNNNVTDNGHVVATGTTNTYTLGGVISGTGNLTKTGTNTVIVPTANNYKGGTVINGGVLQVNNTSGSGTGTGTVAVNNGGTLAGTGTITGATTLNSGGIIEPSAGTNGAAGSLLHAFSLTWNGGGTATFQLGATTGDELSLTGALTKGTAGAYDIDIVDAGIMSSTYTLITFASTTFLPTNFTLELPTGYTGMLARVGNSLVLENLTPPSMEAPAGTLADTTDTSTSSATFSSVGTGSTGSDSGGVMVPAVPEPGSVLLLAFGGTTLLGWRRRRSRS